LPIMDVAIMQIFHGLHELLPRCHPCRWLCQLTLKIPALVIYVVGEWIRCSPRYLHTPFHIFIQDILTYF
jgi:hypothetical protein